MEEKNQEVLAQSLGNGIGLVGGHLAIKNLKWERASIVIPLTMAAVGLGLQYVDNKAAQGFGLGLTGSAVLELAQSKLPPRWFGDEPAQVNGLGQLAYDTAYDSGLDNNQYNEYWVDDEDEEADYMDNLEGLGEAATAEQLLS